MGGRDFSTRAERRAGAALRQYLSPEQKAEWHGFRRKPEIYRRITVQGKQNVFEIRKYYWKRHPRQKYFNHMVEIFINGEERCFGANTTFPADDQVLAIKMAIESDERWVMRVAG